MTTVARVGSEHRLTHLVSLNDKTATRSLLICELNLLEEALQVLRLLLEELDLFLAALGVIFSLLLN